MGSALCTRSNKVAPINKDAEIDRLKAERAELEERYARLESENQAIQSVNESEAEAKERLARERSALRRENSGLRRGHGALHRERQQLACRVEDLQRQHSLDKRQRQPEQQLFTLVKMSQSIEEILRRCFHTSSYYYGPPPPLVKLINESDFRSDVKHRMHYIRTRRNDLVHANGGTEKLSDYEHQTVLVYWQTIVESFIQSGVPGSYVIKLRQLSEQFQT